MHRRSIVTVALVAGLSSLLFVACGGASNGIGTSSSGGTSATGGVSTTGGSPATGGSSSAGGVSGSGGALSTGGASGTGGSSWTGGASGTGGTRSTGGVANTGGVRGTGGVTTSGGSTGTGGTTGTGGVVATGGSRATGGAATGGTHATGGVVGTGGTTSTGGGTAGAGGAGTCELSATWQWSSTGPLIGASGSVNALKDPTILRYENKWHIFGSTVTSAGAYGMFYTSFADWAAASSASIYLMSQTTGFDTYVAAPQLFYFTPQKKWYLVFQSGPPMYSTTTNLADPKSWTKPAAFYASTPAIITQNNGWLDFWVICDTQNCHMFFSDDYGRWYKSKTSVGSFPSGFGTPTIVMQDAEAGRLFEACNVYKVNGTNKYLAIIEAYDSSSNWRRYFRSWTATSLEGPWTVLNDNATTPFASTKNVTFTATPWTNDISHGDVVRSGYDETMPIDACNLQFLIQGFDPSADTTDYNKIPWKLGLLTQK